MVNTLISITALRATRMMFARRMMSTASKVETVWNERQRLDLANFNPNNYDVPIRPATMDDTMEPYGSWKVAYEAERKRSNRILARGVACFVSALLCVYYSGVFDGVLMPNLDNIMEDTEPFNFEKNDDRISV